MPTRKMQIACPQCATAYEVPDAVFGGRARRLRCEQCGLQWRAGPPGAEPEDVAPPPPPQAPVWPEDIAPPPPVRVFGRPADAQAEAEVSQALNQEAQYQDPPQDPQQDAPQDAPYQQEPYSPLQETNMVRGAPLSGALPDQPVSMLAMDPHLDRDDPFINLVHAARSRALELEPELPPSPSIRITSPALFGALIGLFVISMAALVLVHH